MTTPEPRMNDQRLDRLVHQLLAERADDVAADAMAADAMAERIAVRLRPNLIGRRWVLLAAAALLVALAAGAIAVGFRPVRLPAIIDRTPPPAVSFDCAAAQASAAIRTDQWRSGAPLASPRAGWIAAWGTVARPELVLINPLTGETCSLATFIGFNAPPGTADNPTAWGIPRRGGLAWSPDGGALAIVVVDAKPCCRHALYVWSELGLAGPIIEVRDPTYLDVPSWSPDGSLLAVGQTTSGFLGAPDPASAWIIAGDGSAPRQVRAECDACFGQSAYWSPASDQIAFRTWDNTDNGESLGIVAGRVDGDVLPLVPGTHGGDSLLGWASDESLWVVPFGVAVPTIEPAEAGRLFEVPLDPRSDPVDHGVLPAGQGGMPSGVALSPDGTQLLQIVDGPRGGDLVLADFPSGGRERLVEGLPSTWGPVWWSPDGRTIGYLIEDQTPEQGIWLVNADGTGLRKLLGAWLVIGTDTYRLDTTLLKVWQPRP